MSSLIDDLLNSEDIDDSEFNDINLVVNHDDQLSVYQESEKLEWKSGSNINVVMKPTQFCSERKKLMLEL